MKLLKSISQLTVAVSMLAVSGLALAENVVVVNPANGSSLSAGDISRIYLGKMKSFPDGGSIEAINQVESSAIRDEFNNSVVGKSSSQMKSYWSKLIFTGKGTPPKDVANDAAVKAAVAADPNSIGYIDSANVDASVKVIHKF